MMLRASANVRLHAARTPPPPPRARRNAAAYLHNNNIVLTKDGHLATIAHGVKFIKKGGTIAAFIGAYFLSPQRAAVAVVSAAFIAFIEGAMP